MSLNHFTTLTTNEDIRKELNDTDIERLTRRFLCALKDMNSYVKSFILFVISLCMVVS